MAQLWEWEAVHTDGTKHGYMTEEPSGIASESGMLAHLTKHYPNCTIFSLRRCGPFERRKDRIGPMDRHVYQCGAWDLAMQELGHMKPEPKQTLLSEFRRAQLSRVSGIPKDRI